MILRQWIWRLASHAPLAAWGLSLALPVAGVAWVLQSGPGMGTMATVRQQIEASTAAVIALGEQLQKAREGQADYISPDQAPEELLQLLLHHECGLRQEIDLNQAGGRRLLVLNGDSLEALCVLRVVQRFEGGVQRLRRIADGTVSLTWEGAGR